MTLAPLLALAASLAAAPPPLRAPPPPAASTERLGDGGALRRAGDWSATPSGKTVSLSDDMALDTALERIADAAGWNLVLRTGRQGDGSVTVRLRNAPVEEALEAVLDGTRLVATRRGDTVTVAAAPAAAAPPARVLAGFDAPTGKRFTGDLDDVRIEAALRQVASAAGLSLVLPRGLRGSVSGHFADAPVEDVLRAVLAQAGLTARLDGQVLTVERAAGPSLVVEGGKRTLRFEVKDAEDAGEDAPALEDLEPVDAEREASGRERPRAAPNTTFRGDHTVAAGERAGEVVTLGGNVRLEAGAQAATAVAVGGSVEVGPGAQVEGETVAIGGDVHVLSGGSVAGQAVSVGGRVIVDPGGEVRGEEVSVRIPGVSSLVGLLGGHPLNEPTLGWRIGMTVAQFVVFFLLALAAQALMPRRLEAMAASLVRAPWKSALAGILGTLALPVLCLLLLVTVVGIPFIAVVVLAVIAATVVGFSALAQHLGRAVPLRVSRGLSVLQLAIGVAALVLLGQIPVLGPLTIVAAWFALFGAVIRTRFGAPPAPVLVSTAPPAAPPPAM